MSYKKLKEEFDQKVKELQEKCPHTNTGWMGYMWAPGHFGGTAKICLDCQKILEYKKLESSGTSVGNIDTFIWG